MTKEYAKSLVKAYTAYRGDKDAAVVDAIAERMVAHDEGVWHATAQVVRGGLGCNCRQCEGPR